MGIGERIAEERKRLGLSQSAFADLIGVSFSSQRRYENETRAPDTAYLDSLRKKGVDVEYVISGRAKQTAKGYNADYLAEFGLAIAKLYQISSTELNDLARKVSEALDADGEQDEQGQLAIERRVATYESAFFVHVSEFFTERLKSVQASENGGAIDSILLAEVICLLDTTLAGRHKQVDPRKKAQAAAMLYRTFRASGNIDPGTVDEAVNLIVD